jgi:hypothetical protein
MYLIVRGPAGKKEEESRPSDIPALEFLDPGYEVIEFRVRDPDLPLDCINLVQQLADPYVHQVNDELLDNDNPAEQHQHVAFVCHGHSKNTFT